MCTSKIIQKNKKFWCPLKQFFAERGEVGTLRTCSQFFYAFPNQDGKNKVDDIHKKGFFIKILNSYLIYLQQTLNEKLTHH